MATQLGEINTNTEVLLGSERAAANGVASLGADGFVPNNELSGNVEVKGSSIIAASATLSPASFAADQNNYNPTGWIVGGVVQKTILRLQSVGANSITGLVPSSPELGNTVIIINVGLSNMTISNNDSGSDPVNRFLMNGNTLLNPGETATFVRDTVIARWREVSVAN